MLPKSKVMRPKGGCPGFVNPDKAEGDLLTREIAQERNAKGVCICSGTRECDVPWLNESCLRCMDPQKADTLCIEARRKEDLPHYGHDE